MDPLPLPRPDSPPEDLEGDKAADQTLTMDNIAYISQVLDNHVPQPSLPDQSNSPPTVSDDATTDKDTSENDEEHVPLDWKEVLELQTFIDKKDWIIEKTKLLERMPPIQAFVGLESVKASAEEVDGLPTRDQLKEWLAEHDAIEKETEIFDTGELKKLRQFTRAATKRNLSPRDTDLIELTLTTIYEFDKLLHLLRDRSENLDLLSIRLSWEENRIGAWRDRRVILSDLSEFLENRGRWSSGVYDSLVAAAAPTASGPPPSVPAMDEYSPLPQVPTPKSLQRRSSVTSLASTSSLSVDTLASSAFSRAARYKLSEGVSREAAQFSARIATLHHGKIHMAGKVLDKLIDSSRKPVPDELLDEQDRLEEKLAEMDDITKFVSNITLQWRKADEVYIETMKDQNAAQALLDEMEDASTRLPDGKLSLSFSSRAETLLKRLAFRGNPASSSSTFPRPHHPLFPDQGEANNTLTQALSDEIASARHLISQADREAKEYKAAWQAVKATQDLLDSTGTLTKGLESVIARLEHGVDSQEDDGAPPDLTGDDCLQPTKYAAFLALLPTILEEEEKYHLDAQETIRRSHPALVALRALDIDATYHDGAALQFQKLANIMSEARRARESVVGRATRLRESRKIWHSMDVCFQELSDLRRLVGDAMEQARWRQQCTVEGAPPTPESPPPVHLPDASSSLPSNASHENGSHNGSHPQPQLGPDLQKLENKISVEVTAPFGSLSPTLESPLRDRLSRGIESLKAAFQQVDQMAALLESIRGQSEVMNHVKEDFQSLQIRVEATGVKLDSVLSQTLDGSFPHDEAVSAEAEVCREIEEIEKEVENFSNGLSARVPLIARFSKSFKSSLPGAPQHVTFAPKRFSSVDLRLGVDVNSKTIEVPFDLHHLDDAIRNDCNAYVMRISGLRQGLSGKAHQLRLAVLGVEFDGSFSAVEKSFGKASSDIETFKASLRTITEKDGNDGLLNNLESLQTTLQNDMPLLRDQILSTLTPARLALRTMDEYCRTHAACADSPYFTSRSKAFSSLEARFGAWDEDVKELLGLVKDAVQKEMARLEKSRAEEEEERARLERERLEREALEREEAERIAKETHEREEKERLAELARLEKEEERKRAEEAHRLEEERRREDEERLRAANLEKERLAEENKTIEEKLRLAEQLLAEQQRLQQEKERLAAEETEKILVENQRLKDEEIRRLREAENMRIENEKSKTKDRDGKSKKAKGKGKEVATPVSASKSHGAEDDVFGPVSSTHKELSPHDLEELRETIATLRARLRSLSLNELSRPSTPSSSSLPTVDTISRVSREFQQLKVKSTELPYSTHDAGVTAQLRSLRMELMDSEPLVEHLQYLAQFIASIATVDASLSDLLEHIDSFPTAPSEGLAASHRSNPSLSAEDQLKARLAFTSQTLSEVSSTFARVSHDKRAIREKSRVTQAWSELKVMAQEHLVGKTSRPGSVLSSGRTSRASTQDSRTSLDKATTKSRPRSSAKTQSYASLSARPTRMTSPQLAPPTPSRRAFSGSTTSSRPPSQMSISSARSFSGPGTSTLMQGTIASRQRTSSMTPSQKTPRLSESRSSMPRARQAMSPTTSSSSHSHTSSLGTWSRAPRLSNNPISPPPRKKTYVANPKSKLDVAVGDVVNKLPVSIAIQGVTDSWRDQSGQYWIGEEEPKLCFCRILQSQTVMVRVGGGWSELSKFIQDHFADSFRLVESPTGGTAREEPWISSATLYQSQATILESPPEPPKTPEPGTRRIPSFSISSPTGNSPRSLRSTPSSHGSPGSGGLLPIQFLRRTGTDDEPPLPLPSLLRPVTPTRSAPRHRAGLTASPNRPSIWRP